MQTLAMTCQHCGGELDYVDGQKIVFCKYCGSQYRFDDGSRTYVISDVAKIQQINLEKEMKDYDQKRNEDLAKEHYQDKEKTQRWLMTVLITHLIIPMTLFTFFLLKSTDSSALLAVCFCIVVAVGLFGPIFLAAIKPNNATKKSKGFLTGLFYFTIIAVGGLALKLLSYIL